jgi:hypothetical protein
VHFSIRDTGGRWQITPPNEVLCHKYEGELSYTAGPLGPCYP